MGLTVLAASEAQTVPSVFPALTPETYRRSDLHDPAREWPETNCFMDLWIEIINALGQNPVAALGFTVAQDFEGDQFTFFKFPPEDLALLYGAKLMELAIYDCVEAHALEQIERGRLPAIEVNGFYLPDTKGLSYRLEHTKTAIGINRLDPVAKRMDYFHNAGLFTLEGEDYDAILGKNLDAAAKATRLFPYSEFVKFDSPPKGLDLHQTALSLLRKHLTTRPADNPVAAFQNRVREKAHYLAQREPAYFHKYAFNTCRQLGANFELLADHLLWLSQLGEPGLEAAVAASKAIAMGAKSFQFQLARAAARKKFDGLAAQLDPLVAHYQTALDELTARYCA
jgi:hypothetical protein